MNPAAYVEMAETESRHWWFVGRREICDVMVQRLELPRDAEILEVGCGTGGNLAMLARHGRVSAFEMCDSAREIAQIRSGRACEIRAGDCPDNIPFRGRQFDLICLFDVLEHIEDDARTLNCLRPLLKAGGRIMLTVPAYQWLFGAHDTFLAHKRRYSGGELRKKAVAAGFEVVKMSYCNTFLFPLAAAARLQERLRGSAHSAGRNTPIAAVNALLRRIFTFEKYLLPHMNFPFGCSLMGILRSTPSGRGL